MAALFLDVDLVWRSSYLYSVSHHFFRIRFVWWPCVLDTQHSIRCVFVQNITTKSKTPFAMQ